jgi:glucose-6-phosphate-specific signal transduction histidine kinase
MPKEENDIKIAVVVVTAIIVILVLFIGALLILSYAVRNRSLRKQRNILEKQSMLAQLETREQLLKNVSQELHDNIGQVASLLKIGIETLLQDPAYSNNPRL